MVTGDCITGTRMILDDDDNKWGWNDHGRADPDYEEISSQEFSSTDSSSDVDHPAGGEENVMLYRQHSTREYTFSRYS